MSDYYKILEILPSATSRQVKVAYRKLALKYHPDINPENQLADTKFIAIAEAYEILSDPLKRNRYDNGLEIDPHKNFEREFRARRRPPPPYYYYKHKPEKTKYSKRDYLYAIASVVAIVVFAVVFPLYLMQTTSTKYYEKAVSFYLAGKYYSALHNVDLSIKDLSQTNSKACALASIILVHRLKKYDYALKYINRGLGYSNEDSLSSELHYLKGICLAKNHKPQKAILEFGRVEDFNTTYDSSLFKSAVILTFTLTDLDSAEELLEKLILRNKNHYAARYFKGIIHEKKTDHENAYDIFSNLVNKPFNPAATYYHLAKAEIGLNLVDSACAHLQIASQYDLLEAKQLMKLYCKKE